MPSPPGASSGAHNRRRATDDRGSRWASPPQDLVGLLASRVLAAGDLLDYVRFRAVCTSWRSGAASPRFHPRRWMMLPEGHGLYPGHPDLRGHARFLNLDTGALARARIPLLGDHCAIDSVDGLLLLLRDPDPEGALRLLHPFTGDVAELPPLGTLLPQLGSRLHSIPAPYRIRSLAKVVCASVSFNNAGAMTVMLALDEVSRVAFATSMDRQWTLSSWLCPMRYPPLSFQGKLYMVYTASTSCGKNNVHQVLQIDPPVQDRDGQGAVRALQPPKLIATVPEHKLVYVYGLVECGSEILVLGHNDCFGSQILVCKLSDLVLQRFIPMKSIGGSILFIDERSISVSSKVLPTVKGDSVVYIHSGHPYLAQYHLGSGSLSTAIDNCSLYYRMPGPSSLVHHVFSCCIRNQWCVGVFTLFSFCTVSL